MLDKRGTQIAVMCARIQPVPPSRLCLSDKSNADSSSQARVFAVCHHDHQRVCAQLMKAIESYASDTKPGGRAYVYMQISAPDELRAENVKAIQRFMKGIGYIRDDEIHTKGKFGEKNEIRFSKSLGLNGNSQLVLVGEDAEHMPRVVAYLDWASLGRLQAVSKGMRRATITELSRRVRKFIYIQNTTHKMHIFILFVFCDWSRSLFTTSAMGSFLETKLLS